jgi:uncharacterized protein with von Willebrand factor type A (vWA) domain
VSTPESAASALSQSADTGASDLAVQLTGFADTLRAAGVPVDTSRVIAGARALTVLQPLGIDEIYWATRLTFCSRRSDLAVFDVVFLDWFGARPPGASMLDAEPVVAGTTTDTTGVTAGLADAEAADVAEPSVPSREEQLTRRDLAELSAVEREEVGVLIALLTSGCKLRRTLRHQPGGRQQIDLGRTMRKALHNGGEPAYLAYQRPRLRPGRLVLLLDVSESMADYSDALLRFAHAAVRARPATTEVFTLATRLTRLTAELGAPDPGVAINKVGQLESDWRSGTLLATTLRTFLREWGGRRAVRSAVVVLFSDGWTGDADEMREQAGRLSRLSRFLIWADPAFGGANYQPCASGLVRSLPAIDALVPGGSFAALQALAESLPRAERGAIGWHPFEYHPPG